MNIYTIFLICSYDSFIRCLTLYIFSLHWSGMRSFVCRFLHPIRRVFVVALCCISVWKRLEIEKVPSLSIESILPGEFMSCGLHFKHEENCIITILNSINQRKGTNFQCNMQIYRNISLYTSVHTNDNVILCYGEWLVGLCLSSDASMWKTNKPRKTPFLWFHE